jgi:membrane protease YdiL (CAAX protease family)
VEAVHGSRMRPIWLTLVVYVIAAAAVLGLQVLAVTLLVARRGGPLDPERDALTVLLTGVPASSLALIGIAALAARGPWRLALRLVPGRLPARGVVAAVVGILALSQALESLAQVLGVGRGPALDWLIHALADARPAALLLAVVVVGGLAPLGEELFFRGYMLTQLRQVWSAGPAIVVTALAFGLIHGEWIHGALAAGLGLYLGYLVERTGSVVPAVICHAANNTASVLLSAAIASPQGRGVNAVLLLMAALVFAVSLVWLRRLVPPPPEWGGVASAPDRGSR